MKLKVNNYIYRNPKLDNLKILCLSDIHGDIRNINLVLNYLKKEKVDYIFLIGDIVHKISEDNTLFIEKVKELANYAKTYAVLGNHDNLNNKDLISLKEIANNKYISSLKNTNNFYLSTTLYEKVSINPDIDINFIVLPNEYYSKKEDKNVSDLFLNTIEDVEIKDKFNIMLIHSPNPIIKNKKIINNKLINKMNLIISGHNHGGLTPTIIQDLFKNHFGLVGPYYTLFMKNAYGIFKKNNTYLLISNGITKISRHTIFKKLGYLFNNILIPEVDIITFKKDDNYNLSLINRKNYK